MISVRRHFRSVALTWLTICLLVGPTHVTVYAETVVPTSDIKRYGKTLEQLEQLQKTIQTYSKIVGAVREQITMLNTVTSSIRDLQGVVQQGVRGLASSLSTEIGLDQIFAPLASMQRIVTDSQQLIRDVQNLPVEAKRQLADIGLAADQVRTFLKDGLVYDTFYKMGGDQWKEVAKHPWDSLKNGSFGFALMRADDYLSPKERGAAWSEFLSKLTPEQKANMGGFLGPQYVTFLADNWFNGMEQRVKKAVDYREVGNKLTQRLQTKRDSAIGGASPNADGVVQDHITNAAALNWRVKITADTGLMNDKAALILSQQERERLKAQQRTDEDEVADENAHSMNIAP